jgi:hypothetical protein
MYLSSLTIPARVRLLSRELEAGLLGTTGLEGGLECADVDVDMMYTQEGFRNAHIHLPRVHDATSLYSAAYLSVTPDGRVQGSSLGSRRHETRITNRLGLAAR